MLGKKSGHSQNKNQIPSTNDTSSDVPVNEQQQNRIILYFSNGQKISAIPDGEVTITPEQRAKILSQLKSGKISWEDLENFLHNVTMPLTDAKEDIDKVYTQIIQDLRQKQILAVLTGHNATDWQTVNREDLKNLLGKPLKGQPNYRTPVGFALFRQKFLNGIADKATPEQMQDYERAMDDLERKIYGHRFDYYQQLRLMKYSATTHQTTATPTQTATEQSSTNQPVTKQTITPTPKEPTMDDQMIAELIQEQSATAAQAVATAAITAQPAAAITAATTQPATPTTQSQQSQLVTSTILSQEQSLNLLSHAIFTGDPWKQDGNEYPLTANNLFSNNLLPAVSLQINGQNLALTQPFQLSNGQGAALGFISVSTDATNASNTNATTDLQNTATKVRAFYLDEKSGLWHFAPDIIRGPRGEGMSQITEGYGPESTLIPFVLQQKLTELVKNYGFREITTVNPDFLFAATAPAYNTVQDFREALSRGQVRSDFYREVDKSPVIINAQSSGDKIKAMPQLLSVNTDIAPVFPQLLGTFATYSAIVGPVLVHAFPSSDGTLTWLFCSDDYGRAWIGGIEVVSSLTSTACHQHWASAGDLLTPLYETSTQAGNHGDPTDIRRGLVGMWNRYLSNVTIIREFLTWKSQTK